MFGHLADGNIHVEAFGPAADDPAVDQAVLGCVARYGGSISAEHGVGRAKAADLHLCRSDGGDRRDAGAQGRLGPAGADEPRRDLHLS